MLGFYKAPFIFAIRAAILDHTLTRTGVGTIHCFSWLVQVSFGSALRPKKEPNITVATTLSDRSFRARLARSDLDDRSPDRNRVLGKFLHSAAVQAHLVRRTHPSRRHDDRKSGLTRAKNNFPRVCCFFWLSCFYSPFYFSPGMMMKTTMMRMISRM